MRNPIDVLKLLTEKASVKGYTFERLYRNLYNPDFYLLAYKNIAASPGSMTTGADGLSIDNMSMARINKIIASLKDQTYQPNPARRTYIAKKNNPTKKRPLGIPSTNDKLVQEKYIGTQASFRLQTTLRSRGLAFCVPGTSTTIILRVASYRKKGRPI